MDNFKYYKLYLKDKKKAKYLVFLKSFITSYYLKNFGFDSNTVPVLDLPENNTSLFIKKRTFGPNLLISKVLNEIIILNTINHGLIPVIKHIPGHGVTSKDSHKVIPKSNHKMSELSKHFKSFNNFNYLPLAMTSHIVYKAIDDKNIATFSEAVINKIIRNKINFQGLLMSDDLSMKAVNYTPEAICNIANKIDIDILLDCSDDIDRYIYFSKNFIPKNRYKKFIKIKQVWHLKSNINQSINIDKYRDIYDNMI